MSCIHFDSKCNLCYYILSYEVRVHEDNACMTYHAGSNF
jgi:hypothetical protein